MNNYQVPPKYININVDETKSHNIISSNAKLKVSDQSHRTQECLSGMDLARIRDGYVPMYSDMSRSSGTKENYPVEVALLSSYQAGRLVTLPPSI